MYTKFRLLCLDTTSTTSKFEHAGLTGTCRDLYPRLVKHDLQQPRLTWRGCTPDSPRATTSWASTWPHLIDQPACPAHIWSIAGTHTSHCRVRRNSVSHPSIQKRTSTSVSSTSRLRNRNRLRPDPESCSLAFLHLSQFTIF